LHRTIALEPGEINARDVTHGASKRHRVIGNSLPFIKFKNFRRCIPIVPETVYGPTL
jgi:hypothetical protein